jgi:hypothetical protein
MPVKDFTRGRLDGFLKGGAESLDVCSGQKAV